jgi:hypothetical protein
MPLLGTTLMLLVLSSAPASAGGAKPKARSEEGSAAKDLRGLKASVITAERAGRGDLYHTPADALPAGEARAKTRSYNHTATVGREMRERKGGTAPFFYDTKSENHVKTPLGTVLVLQRRVEKAGSGETKDFLVVEGVIQGTTRVAKANAPGVSEGDRITDVLPVSGIARELVRKELERKIEAGELAGEIAFR